MNISEHTSNFIQEMKRRNYSQNTINNYASCINYFFSSSTKDHPKNINEKYIKDFLVKMDEPNTQIKLNNNEKTNDNIIPLYGNNELPSSNQKSAF